MQQCGNIGKNIEGTIFPSYFIALRLKLPLYLFITWKQAAYLVFGGDNDKHYLSLLINLYANHACQEELVMTTSS